MHPLLPKPLRPAEQEIIGKEKIRQVGAFNEANLLNGVLKLNVKPLRIDQCRTLSIR